MSLFKMDYNCKDAIASRVARFLLVHDTKPGKNVPNEHKMYQIVINNPNVCKIFLMVIKYINIFQFKALKNFPKLGFLV
jgi:hypothetical protein